MASPTVNAAGFYADFAQMEKLRNSAARDPQTAVRAAAKQFESLFTQMMLKSMRQANLGEGMGDSEETKFYQDMFDQQLAVQLSSGKGIGLADKLIAQLQRSGQAGAPAAPGAAGAANAAGTTAPATVRADRIIHGPTLPMAAETTSTAPATSVPATSAPAAPMPVADAQSAGADPATTDPATTAAAMAPRAANAREAFIDSIRPAAERIAQQLGVSTETILAHAALETGWGRHLPSAGSNNLFGIKSGGGWQGASVSVGTREVLGGQALTVQASFRAYGSVEDGLADYAAMVASPRYAQALGSGADVAAYARGLRRGGYATDPSYVQKLVDTAASVRQVIAATPLKSGAARPTTAAGETG